MITLQNYCFLLRLKNVQHTEDDILYLDTEKMTLSRVYASDESAPLKSIAKYQDSYHSIISSLVKNSLLTVHHQSDGELYCQVTHEGFHVFQGCMWKALYFLCKSILVPIAVSILTAAITTFVLAA